MNSYCTVYDMYGNVEVCYNKKASPNMLQMRR